jgi:hypothetical protein
MRVFFFAVAALAALGVTVLIALGYPALVVITMELHAPLALFLVRDLGPFVLIVTLWAGLIGAFFVTRPAK